MKTLNYKKMLEDIDKIVNNDFVAEMEMGLLPNSKAYTQEEAKEMAKRLASVYSVSHCLTCWACRGKYESKSKEEGSDKK